jgi:hypothetical protein
LLFKFNLCRYSEAVRDHHGLDVPLRNAAMGASHHWGGSAGKGPGLGMVMGDAGVFMAEAAAAVAAGTAPPAAVVLLDAYDGEGDVPAHLLSPDFLDDCAAVLAPGGVVVANLFNGINGGGLYRLMSVDPQLESRLVSTPLTHS